MTLKPSKVEKIVNFASFYVLKFLKNMLKMLFFFKLQYLKIPKLENFGSYLILTVMICTLRNWNPYTAQQTKIVM